MCGKHLTKSAIYLPLFEKEFKSYWPLRYFGQAWKKLVSLAVVFSIVTQRSSKVEANQNTAFDKRIVSKQKHKRAKPFGWTWAFKHISWTEVLPRRYTKSVHLLCTEFVSGETFYRSSINLGTNPTSSEVAYSNQSTRTLTNNSSTDIDRSKCHKWLT